jgi:hypothetical protein
VLNATENWDQEILKSDYQKLHIIIADSIRIPYSHESRFAIQVGGWIIPILNIRTEKFEAIREKLEDNRVWTRVWTEVVSDAVPRLANYWGLINDGRIGPEFYAPNLCWLGSSYPPIEIAQEICVFSRLDNDDIEQFTDPVAYWEKRGGRFDKGWVSLQG